MKNFRNILSAAVMVAVITLGTTFANAGILVAGKTGSYTRTTTTRSTDPCSATRSNSGILVAGATGILVAGFTGILVAGFTGILVAGATRTGSTQTNCGILVAG